MNKHLQAILNLLQQSETITPEEKRFLTDALKESDKEITITEFKLQRTEKVKRTTAILLEETIAELEEKRKAVEEQNRELEIEAAMERVRSKSMAMHQSSELGDLSFELVKQVQALGIATWHCAFNIYDEGQESSTEWGSNANGSYPIYKTPREGIFKRYYEIGQKGEALHVEVIGEDRCADHYAYLCTLPGVGETLIKVRDSGIPFPKSQIDHVAYFKYGYLLFITFEPSPEAHDVFKRFAKVFEQTYTRFLDLQKAEAQAREAQIQLALERVRARTMAMQKSDELREVVAALYEQLRQLNFDANACNIIIIDKETNNQQYWVSGFTQKLYPESYNVPYFKHPYIDVQLQSWRQGKKYTVIEYSGRTKKEFDKQFFSQTEFKNIPEEVQEIIKAFEAARLSTAFFTYGALQIIGPGSLSDENAEILQRFAVVFDQTYTRFLDLQKAEAQAWEAQIEAALERVRSRTIAMQRSEELVDAASILFQQVKSLGVPQWNCGFNIWELGDKEFTYYPGSPDGIILPAPCKIPLAEHPVFMRFDESRKRGDQLLVYEKEGQFQADHYRYMHSLRPGVGDLLQSMLDAGFQFPTFQIDHVANFSYGNLIFITYEHFPKMHDVFKRFAKVFEQTYTRFLDLQKAEAQAREAQIEAALEKVRSRSMGMQKSDELKEVIQVVFNQFVHLNISLDHAGFVVDYKPRGDWHFWITDRQRIPSRITHPYFDSVWANQFNEAKEKGITFFATNLDFEEKNKFYRDLFTFVHGVPEESKEFYFNSPGVAISNVLFENVALYIENFSGIPYTDEENAVLIRFGKVFEQTYTRFLDLQKAEALAREAQIEASLERVRSRSLAMHKSDELAFVVDELFQRLKELEIGFDSVNILQFTEDAFQIWAAYQPGKFTVTKIPYSKTDIPYVNTAVEAKNRGQQLFTHQYLFEEKNLFLRYLFEETHFINLPEDRKEFLLQAPCYTVSIGFAKNTALQLQSYSRAAFSESENELLMRFVNVFEQCYTRFLDLQKAEAQAKEAQIEAALERVRSKTMAMRSSDELAEVVGVLFKQLETLEFGLFQILLIFIDTERNVCELWRKGTKNSDVADRMIVPNIDHPLSNAWTKEWKNGTEYSVYNLEGETKRSWDEYLFTQTDLKHMPQEVKDQMRSVESAWLSDAFMKYGSLQAAGTSPLSDQQAQILIRFAKSVDHAYTRIIDLQKAEAQAREAQIEASLERVRSKTMAMHNSHDVGNTVATLFGEVTKLGVKTNRCGILIFSTSDDTEVWAARPNPSGEVNLIIGHLDTSLHPLLSGARNGWRDKQTTFSYEMIGEDLINYYQMINNQSSYPFRVNMETLQSKEIHTEFYFPDGAVFSFTPEPVTADDAQIFKRLAGVFGQTYRRYLDLQRAEAQAREAQIEAALERVRSRTMAMHRSEEIADILGKIFKELTALDVNLNRVHIWIFNPDEKFISWWSSNPESETNAESYRVDYFDHPVFLEYYEAWHKKQALLLYTLGGDLKKSWEDHLFQNTELSRLPKAVQDGMRSEEKIFTTSAISDYGLMMAGYFEPFTDEVNDIIQRFGRVFQQSYTRYVDVQKAEAQAREATIEAALEKVRGKAMAMHNSNDLTSTATLVFTELRKLGINSFRSGVGLLTKENRKVKLYSATSSADGDGLSVVGWATLDDHPVLSKTYDNWLRKEDYFPVLRGEELKTYYEKVISTFTVPVTQAASFEQYGYFLPFSEGLFYGWSENPYTEAEVKILHRFKAIVDLTFRRYMELQKSEANALEAIRQASLDRVRAEIASMRTTSDLDRITPLIWKELNTLNVPFVRCGVFIMDERQQQIHTFLSTPDGKAIAAFHLPYDAPGNVGEILSHWKKNETYISHWDHTAFRELGEFLIRQGAITTIEVYMNTIPGDGIYLHCLPFIQGMLYVGNTTQLKEDEIHLIQSVADAFATAYARYEDFNKLEAAKQQVDKTLNDLKLTQNQLLISEKMASLGELTAGIAHEIQNPLNFVNNFSEVSNELLNEMNEEIEKGNFKEVKSITDDVRKNLEKILHHGKRADGIVKGMLQHSRTSSGVKEPTDINVLADEYLRLAFHGFRAKDKSFNVTTKTNFDETIHSINVVPQDIGRVILNLITNAFYTVSEKKKQSVSEYEPIVLLSTKRRGDCVLISVKDNGNGIPPKVLDKIFQPFFTTKPTGQGTGLGLSLSYDIVKAHGGELKVETTQFEGARFIIQLPL